MAIDAAVFNVGPRPYAENLVNYYQHIRRSDHYVDATRRGDHAGRRLRSSNGGERRNLDDFRQERRMQWRHARHLVEASGHGSWRHVDAGA